jgi:hypothetical protein
VASRPSGRRWCLKIGFDRGALPARALLALAHTNEVEPLPARHRDAQVPPCPLVMVGSRGDVQPFIPIGASRGATACVRDASRVPSDGRRPGWSSALEATARDDGVHRQDGGSIIPTRLDQLWEDVPKKRAMIAEILASTWRACTEADPERPGARPFRTDLIVANPPSYGHIHCAEALHIPLHMIFTMPWSATRSVPHPFAQIDPSAHRPVENFFSYGVIDLIF